ncbi:MAG: hypothetical protein ABIN95_08560 [Mucilaginibacter sp.]
MGIAEVKLITRIRVNLSIVITGLAISGITAFPLESELAWMVNNISAFPAFMQEWLITIYNAISDTNKRYPT